MANQDLREYPELIDPFLDFEATRKHFGTGACNYGRQELKLSSSKILVYLNQQREGLDVVSTPTGLGRICELGIIICGYKVRPGGLFGFLKKPRIKPIPECERKQAKLELELANRLEDIEYVDFWN